MLTTNTLMNAVEAALKRLYPGEPVYYDELPKDFRRPSFTLECQKAEQSDVNIGLVRRSVTLLVTCYVEADAYHDSSRKALNQRQDTVMGLFAQGFFQVEDRALTVQANRGLGLSGPGGGGHPPNGALCNRTNCALTQERMIRWRRQSGCPA